MHLIEYNPERVLEFSNSVRLWVRLWNDDWFDLTHIDLSFGVRTLNWTFERG